MCSDFLNSPVPTLMRGSQKGKKEKNEGKKGKRSTSSLDPLQPEGEGLIQLCVCVHVCVHMCVCTCVHMQQWLPAFVSVPQ